MHSTKFGSENKHFEKIHPFYKITSIRTRNFIRLTCLIITYFNCLLKFNVASFYQIITIEFPNTKKSSVLYVSRKKHFTNKWSLISSYISSNKHMINCFNYTHNILFNWYLLVIIDYHNLCKAPLVILYYWQWKSWCWNTL